MILDIIFTIKIKGYNNLKKFYYELKITPTAHYDLYLDLILSISNDALEELENSIIVRSEEPLDAVKKGVEFFTNELKSIDENIKCVCDLQTKQNEDWIKKYQDSIGAIVVGKFHIHPQWIDAKEDKLNILINPALAFGSGHHETTSTCLEAISKYVKKDDTLIDVGTGSGILAIGASKLGAICDLCDSYFMSLTTLIEWTNVLVWCHFNYVFNVTFVCDNNK